MNQRPHSFHIPVMGTGFTVDTPLRVAKYGISSVISLVDDVLIEEMRRFHCERSGEPYEAIASRDEDCRARRITAYLNLIDRLVRRDVARLQASPFQIGGEITRYFELLPESPLKRDYREMMSTADPVERARRQAALRPRAVPGGIDVNVMTRFAMPAGRGEGVSPEEADDGMAAVRGYAMSDLASSIVFSAGLNPRLFTYAARFAGFRPDETGALRKKIVLKVSDFRSGAVQAKFLAKRGLWVSEYRIESGLNCGGHAFATDGRLLGPTLAEFFEKRRGLIESVFPIYAGALAASGGPVLDAPYDVAFTVQGGIGTAEGDRFLREHYGFDGTGWGSPFLLVPEMTNVDEDHLKRLLAATERDVVLTDSSPLGVPFWMLRTSASEEARLRRIREGRPGSPCPKRFAAMDTEFTSSPICVASAEYVRKKLERLSQEGIPEEVRSRMREGILGKACICHDLAGGATRRHGIEPTATPSVCCGPNILNFKKIATLDEMADHIYGREVPPRRREGPAPDVPHGAAALRGLVPAGGGEIPAAALRGRLERPACLRGEPDRRHRVLPGPRSPSARSHATELPGRPGGGAR